ncbi:hypothetical protein Cni_G13292 [Canna indica]|uniref:Uncharacterized protein n=1 Tax=Canna indica TaxID=4628 RepID=A0AAQ3KF86_9LILI|nr:hypothetical protein Cni_G13292 [Canna indica]
MLCPIRDMLNYLEVVLLLSMTGAGEGTRRGVRGEAMAGNIQMDGSDALVAVAIASSAEPAETESIQNAGGGEEEK